MRVENEILQNLPSGSFFQEHVPLSLRKIFTDRFTAFGHQGASRGQPIPADYTTSENGYTSKNENGEELRALPARKQDCLFPGGLDISTV